jgi:hypothetical protein
MADPRQPVFTGSLKRALNPHSPRPYVRWETERMQAFHARWTKVIRMAISLYVS